MLVPLDLSITVRHLDKANTAFEKASCQKALTAEIGSDFFIEPVELAGQGCFAGEILDFGNGLLHSEREFIGCDSPLQQRRRTQISEVFTVHVLQQVELAPLEALAENRVARIAELRRASRLAGHSERSSLAMGRKKS